MPSLFSRLNRLTGLPWWRHSPLGQDDVGNLHQQEQVIGAFLRRPSPSALGKIGTSELRVLEFGERWFQLPWPQSASWRRPAERLHNTGGLFPVRKDIFFRFADEYRVALAQMDLVALWQDRGTYESFLEARAADRWAPSAARTGFYFIRFIKPYAQWLEDLARLRWLVVHPFEKTIRAQLPHIRDLGVFSEISFPDLKTRIEDTSFLAPPQFSYMTPPRHQDWFEALDELKARMEKANFDIALVGAGAWSLPLVAHAKKIGKKGIHMGGALQLLFGVKGGRFDPAGIYNHAWIRPLPEDIPNDFKKMEKGAYW